MERFHNKKVGDKIVEVRNNSADDTFSMSDECVIGIGLFKDRESVYRSILSGMDVQKEFYPIAEIAYTANDRDFDNLIMDNIIFTQNTDGYIEGTISLGTLRRIKKDLGL